MGAFDTVLSCGPRLRARLLESEEVREKTTRIFPVVSRSDEKLPFIAFARTGLREEAVKPGVGPQVAYFEFQIYAQTWKESLEIADAVNKALTGFQDDAIRLCRLDSAAPEDFFEAAPAYVQSLTFMIKIR